jgi:aromatic amino acid aminotransferase I
MAPPSAMNIEAVTDTQAIAIPEALTPKGVHVRRAKSGRLIAGTAAHTTSDFFKSPVSTPIKTKELC